MDGASIEEAEKQLEKAGLQGIFTVEEDAVGEIFIGGYSKKKIGVKKITLSFLAEEKNESKVDWQSQWELFAQDFKEGRAHIDLSPFGVDKTLLLTPGAGFGDLSHPTTYLMLEMMRGRISGKSVVDIGSGSGILALAACLLGAESAVGVEIDGAAIAHAKENAKINGLDARASFGKKIGKRGKYVFLMNMIFPEQKAFKPEKLNKQAELWIVSGLLAEQKKEYLQQAKEWGWRPVAEHPKFEWLGWVFEPIPPL
jgi:ribosomal protein L11 methyltransferase